MKAHIVLLPGDGIGPEVTRSAHRVMSEVAARFGHTFTFAEYPIGGISIDQFGLPLTDDTISACKGAHAILLGAVGGPKWDDPNAKTRPEAGLLKIRKELGLFANLRPIITFPELLDASPLKRNIIEGTDILFYRELTGGLYFGPSGCETLDNGEQKAYSTAVYTTSEVERIV
ncbi:MAG: isocitrate/isopropylmalate family dehydrogenase, partial [Pirellula sp.]|nr:isocitrate/isopropylmalate family dehydrogenase [Pirellula sp.]